MCSEPQWVTICHRANRHRVSLLQGAGLEVASDAMLPTVDASPLARAIRRVGIPHQHRGSHRISKQTTNAGAGAA
jgi:hypothetical protein